MPTLRSLLPRLLGPLGPLDEAGWALVEAHAEWLHLAGGQTLFEQDDAAEHWFVVASGRLAVLVPGAAGEAARRLADAGAGEVIGELAVLTGRPRSATVQALRDSSLLRLPASLLDTLLAQAPQQAMALLRHLAQRLADRTPRRAAEAAAIACTVTLLPASAEVDAVGLARRLAASLSRQTRVATLGRAALAAAGLALPADSRDESRDEGRVTWARVDAWLDAFTADHDLTLLLADPRPSAWTRHVLQRADHVLVLADAGADPAPAAHERAWLDGLQRRAAAPPLTLALLHADGSQRPQGTARWLDARPALAHRHVRLDRDDDIARLARHLTGRGVALALSGGGARCFSQLGVAIAMRELGIPIDGIAATSGGSMCGTLLADERDEASLRASAGRFHMQRPYETWTLPLFSLRSGSPLDAALQEAAGGAQIEDLWLPLVVVSANLTRARVQLHTRGPAWRAVRASSALPGIVEPVLDGGELLVDGGLVDNLPVDVARRLVGGRVLAVDVAQDTAPAHNASAYPSPWRALPVRLGLRPGLRSGPPLPPSIASVLLHSLLLGSLAHTRQQREAADLCLRPPLTRYGMLDIEHWSAIIDAGYQHALQALTGFAADSDERASQSGRPSS